MIVKIQQDWLFLLENEFKKAYFEKLIQFVKSEYSSQKIFPSGHNIFKAFDICPPQDIKVVIIGQDPYHGSNQAHGLSFSVKDNIPLPPSLKNIFKEIKADLGIEIPISGNLTRWAEQGVLLLNATLTVRANEPASHQGHGWETFTDNVIKLISEKNQNIVFLLWGGFAHKKIKLIDTEKHFILKSKHPSPLSANQGGWFGMKHFSQANNYLIAKGKTPISW